MWLNTINYTLFLMNNCSCSRWAAGPGDWAPELWTDTTPPNWIGGSSLVKSLFAALLVSLSEDVGLAGSDQAFSCNLWQETFREMGVPSLLPKCPSNPSGTHSPYLEFGVAAWGDLAGSCCIGTSCGTTCIGTVFSSSSSDPDTFSYSTSAGRCGWDAGFTVTWSRPFSKKEKYSKYNEHTYINNYNNITFWVSTRHNIVLPILAIVWRLKK